MTETVTIKLGKSMKEELRTLAAADRRTLSSYVALILEDYLKQQRTAKGATKRRGE